MPMLMKALSEPLVEAALDQRRPTPALAYALNRALFALGHPDALNSLNMRDLNMHPILHREIP